MLVEVESAADGWLSQVGTDILQIWRPVHTARGRGILESYIVHVDALLISRAFHGEFKDSPENVFTLRVFDMTRIRREVLVADSLHVLELLSLIRAFLYNTSLQTELQIRIGLVWGRDPSIAYEQPGQVPFSGRPLLTIAIQDSFGNVGDVLTCKGFASEVDLAAGR